MNILINYADVPYRPAQKLNSWTGKHIAHFDKVIEYSPDDLDVDFREKYADILAYKRGNGLWLWKPYILLKSLQEADEGDVVFYCDSGSFFIKKPTAAIELAKKNGIWVTASPLYEWQFTKRKCIEMMDGDCDSILNTAQCLSGFIAAVKNEESIDIAKEWLKWCSIRDAVAPELENEVEGFASHREDQSVLSIILKKRNKKIYQDPSQFGRLPEKYYQKQFSMVYYDGHDYDPFIVCHRQKKPDFWFCFKQVLCAVLPRKIGLKMINKEDQGLIL